MGKAPCCDKDNVKRGPWSPEEDETLRTYIQQHGTGGNWIAFPKKAGLRRCGKSCRLRWLNYLRPDIRHGGFSEEEDILIYSLYRQMGSRWSIIASQLDGRTDNDIKNHWNTKLKKRLSPTVKNHNSLMMNNNTENSLNANNNFYDDQQAAMSNLEYYYPNLGFSSLLTENLQAPSVSLAYVNNYGPTQTYMPAPTNYAGLILTSPQQHLHTTNKAKIINQSVSTSQEETSTITSSFSVSNLEDKYGSTWANGNGVNDYGSFIMDDLGLGFSNEIGSGFWSSLVEKGGDYASEGVLNGASSFGANVEVYDDDVKPQGLLQSLINQ